MIRIRKQPRRNAADPAPHAPNSLRRRRVARAAGAATAGRTFLEPLDGRQMMTGVVDTSRPFFFQPTDVPTLVARLAPGGANASELAGIRDSVEPYLNGTHPYVPGETTAGDDALADRGAQWVNLATLFRYKSANPSDTTVTRSASEYSSELISQINAFSAAYDTEAERLGTAGSPAWSVLDVGARAQNWVQTYYLMYEPGNLTTWNTSVRNTFNNMLGLQGDFLYDNASPSGANVPNQRSTGYAGLYLTAMTSTLGGFNWNPSSGTASGSSDWLTKANNAYTGEVLNLTSNATGHFRADGGHFEQSPSYGGVVLNSLMKVAYLEQANGVSTIFNATNKAKLATITNALYNMAGTDGRWVETGDTDRGGNIMGTFALPAMYLDGTVSLEYNRPQFGQVMVGYKDNTGTTLANAMTHSVASARPASSSTSPRADAFQPNSGFAELRKNATLSQLTFDAGPYGGYTATSGHGQYDLLNVELSSAYNGNYRALIEDPGYGAKNTWAHNAITLVNNSNGKYVDHGAYGFNNGASTNDAASSTPGYFAASGSVSGSSSIVRGANRGFDSLNPGTVAYRTVYSSKDVNGAYLIMDWVGGPNYNNQVEVGFNLGGAGGADPMTVGTRSGYTSTFGDGNGDVWVEPISLGGFGVTGSNRRVGTDKPTADGTNDGLRFTDKTSSSAPNVAFLTLVQPYTGSAPSLPTLSVVSVNASTGTIVVSLNGTNVTLDRINPTWSGAAPAAASSGKTFGQPTGTLSLVARSPDSSSSFAKKDDEPSLASQLV